jgi:16S rRNA G966 N2-methylase RsmD
MQFKNKFALESQKLIPHINHAIIAKTHPPMYLMHKYWARKPDNVVREYIEHYTKEGETVLDPFCGSGVTVIEALRTNRKAIGVDLDPVSVFITRMTGMYLDIDKFQRAFDELELNIKEKVLELYETTCPECKKSAQIEYIIFSGSEAVKVRFECSHCGAKGDKPFTQADKKHSEIIEKMKIPHWYPDKELIWNTRVNVHAGMKVSDLFSKRNLIALSIIYHAIKKIPDENIRNAMRFAFSSALPQASKLLVYTPGQGPGWKIRGFWVPKQRYEMNVWHFFENRYHKILKGKDESNKLVGTNFKENETVWLYNKSATDMSVIPADSVDYIFTDPPYGDSVPYLELNYMWGLWLEFEPEFGDEIIISDSPLRKEKNEEMYSKMMGLAFREMYRVLKSDHWMTVTFHNSDILIYNIIIKAAIIAGFDLEKIIYQPGATVSPKAQLAPYGSAVGDYYIRFKKPMKSRGILPEAELDKERYERIIVDSVRKVIAHRGEPTPYSYIINSYSLIYEELKKNGYLFSASEGIDEVLKKHIDKEFILVPKADANGKIIGYSWWFKDPKSVPFLERVPLSERVEKAVINKLNSELKITFDDILQEIFIRFPNSLTPVTSSIESVLSEYAEKVKDGKWRLKTSVKSRENEHDKIIECICQIGEKLGFDVYGDTVGRRKKLTFKVDEEKLARIQEIDALWYRNGTIQYEFEVENSTGITEAIVRGANIGYSVKRIIIIPEERDALLARKLREPALTERIAEDKWLFVRYADFYKFYAKSKRGKPNPKDLENLHKLPKSTRTNPLDDYFVVKK